MLIFEYISILSPLLVFLAILTAYLKQKKQKTGTDVPPSVVPPPEAVETGKRVPAWLSWLRATNVWQAAFVRPFVTDRKGIGYFFCYVFGMMFVFLGVDPILEHTRYGLPGPITTYPQYVGTVTQTWQSGRDSRGGLELKLATGEVVKFVHRLPAEERRKIQPGMLVQVRGIPRVSRLRQYLALAEVKLARDGSHVLTIDLRRWREDHSTRYSVMHFIFILGVILLIWPTLRNWKPVTDSKLMEKLHVPN